MGVSLLTSVGLNDLIGRNPEDYLARAAALAENPAAIGQVFNVGAHQEISIEELARRVLEAVTAGAPGKEPLSDRIVHIPYDEAYADGFEDMRRRVPDTTKLNQLTGWEPQVSFEETLRKVIDSYRNGEG